MSSIAKITAPKPVGLVPRHRLFHLIDAHRVQPITWISSPAGAGKTSLVSSYVAARRIPCLWYQIDGSDATVANVFYNLGRLAQKASPRSKRPLPLLTPEYLLDIQTFTTRFFEQFFSRMRPGGMLVLDNYHEMPETSPVHRVMCDGLSLIPAGIRVLVMSRQAPPALFSRLRANSHVAVMRWKDLRLDLQESVQIAEGRAHRELSREEAAHIHQAVQGWAAGLVMMIEETKASGAIPTIEGIFTSQDIFDYFAGEVFERVDRRFQEFLLKTAFLPKISVSAAGELTGFADAADMLSLLSHTGYFTVEHRQKDPSYEYHPLFRGFLITRAGKDLAGPALVEVRKQAARLLENEGQTEDAAILLIELGEWEALASLIIKHAPAMAEQGRTETLERWISSMPPDALRKTGWLFYWLGICRLPVDFKESRLHLENAFALFEIGGHIEGQLLSWGGIVDSIIASWDNVSLLDPWIAWLDGHLSPPFNISDPQVAATVATRMLKALIVRQPHHPLMHQWLQAAHRIMRQNLYSPSSLQAGTSLTIYYWWLGNYAMLDTIVKQLGSAAASPLASPLTAITYKWQEATWAAFCCASPALCLEAVREGLEIARSSGVHSLDFLLCGEGASGSLMKEDMDSAGSYLGRMASVMHGHNSQSLYHFLFSWYAYLAGSRADAVVHAEQALALSVESGAIFPEAICRLAYANLLLESDMPVEAAAQIATARHIIEATGSENLLFMCCLTAARICFADKTASRDTDGLRCLSEAMAIGRLRGYLTTLWWVPAWMTQLCLKALETGIEVDYVCRLVLARHLIPDFPPYHCRQWPWELRISTLGRFEIQRNGQPVVFPNKSPRRLLLLLKALVAGGPLGIPEVTLADLLWPEAAGDTALKSLATALHRLRHLLGNDEAIALRDGRLRINPRICWVDAHAFEELLARAEKCILPNGWNAADNDPDEACRLLDYAVMLYEGAFLDEVSETWALSYRERLLNKFHGAILMLGEHYEQDGTCDRARRLYERGLQINAATEPLYRRLMRIYLAHGRRAEALLTYRRCRRALRSILGLTPSPETRKLRDAIQRDARHPD
ncbi:MAG: hypothetical protein VR64_03380 [Desulfatitalea sp. BRH_c12]|nr:MAG: hypothetical protein VR64_03380 [Desulfatitalea sp. BRH_c12]